MMFQCGADTDQSRIVKLPGVRVFKIRCSFLVGKVLKTRQIC
jgi:hypothetical protein